MVTTMMQRNKHPMGQVTNTQVVIPSYGLSAEYDARGKVSSIYEYGSWKEATFTYGPDGGRWQMAVTDYGDYDDEWTYLGDMEKFQKGHSTVRGYWYLGHGVMMFRDTDNPAFNTMTPLYAFTDNQGSYIDFYRSNGTRVFEAKYDPWGVETLCYEGTAFTLTTPYDIEDLEIVISDADGNTLYYNKVDVTAGSFIFYVPSEILDEMALIELYYGDTYLYGEIGM